MFAGRKSVQVQSHQFGLMRVPAQIEMMTDDESAIVRIKSIEYVPVAHS